jgi:hypothetical protein
MAQTTYVFQENLNGYTGTSDTYFQTGDAAAIHGDETEWEWDASDGGVNYGFLHFADIIGTGPNQIPLDSDVTQAILELTVINEGNSGEIATVHNLLLPFTEEMDFIEFTLNPDVFPGEEYEEEVVAEIPGPPAGAVISIDVTSSLQRWVSGDLENNGWLFFPQGGNGVGIQSSELSISLIPRLVISTPEGEFVFEDGADGYSGTVDTFLNTGNGAADINGEDANWGWDADDNGGQSFGLIRFDDIFGTAPNQVPPGTTIDSAIIFLVVMDSGDVANVHEILEGSEDEPTDFDETSTSMIDWGDLFEPRPGIDYAEEAVATAEGTTGEIQVDVTATIQKYSDGEANRGWIFVPTGGGGVDVAASDRAGADESGPPKLTVIVGGGTGITDFSVY